MTCEREKDESGDILPELGRELKTAELRKASGSRTRMVERDGVLNPQLGW